MPSHFTFSGSRWSKKLLVPVSNVAIAAMSSVLSSKSSTLKFSTMRSLRTELDRTTRPRRDTQRSITISLNPQFRGDKQLFSGESAPLDPSTNRGLVEIGRGSVNQAIACVNGINHALFTCGRIGNLEHAKAKKGHCDSVVQCALLHEPPPDHPQSGSCQ